MHSILAHNAALTNVSARLEMLSSAHHPVLYRFLPKRELRLSFYRNCDPHHMSDVWPQKAAGDSTTAPCPVHLRSVAPHLQRNTNDFVMWLFTIYINLHNLYSNMSLNCSEINVIGWCKSLTTTDSFWNSRARYFAVSTHFWLVQSSLGMLRVCASNTHKYTNSRHTVVLTVGKVENDTAAVRDEQTERLSRMTLSQRWKKWH